MKDSYLTISKFSNDILFKDKNSKFFAYAFSFHSEESLGEIISNLKMKHPKAGHFCYAYQIGKTEKEIIYRVNDDGEPNNSAGMPIYGQIQSFGLTNVLIVVVRYFGGTKLGISGLINAYRSASELALKASKIVEKTINITYLISFEYDNINKVMRIIKERNLNVIDQKLELSCQIKISVRQNEAETVFNKFNRLYKVEIESVND